MYFFFKMSIYSCDASESRSWLGLVADPRGETLQNSDSSSAVAGKKGRYICIKESVHSKEAHVRRTETELAVRCICNCTIMTTFNLFAGAHLIIIVNTKLSVLTHLFNNHVQSYSNKHRKDQMRQYDPLLTIK